MFPLLNNKKSNFKQIDENNFKNSEFQFHLIASYSFSILDIFIMIIFFYFFGINLTNILKIKWIILILLDIILRLINILFIIIFNLLLLKEIIISIIAAYQFVLLILFLNDFFSNKHINIEAKNIKIENKFLSFFVIFGFIIEYDSYYSYFIKVIYGATYIINIIFLLLLYKNISENFNKLLLSLHREQTKKKSNNNYMTIQIINRLSYISLISLIIYYILKIIKLFSENTLFYYYMNIIPKEIGKYLIFICLVIIYYFFINNSYKHIKNKKKTKKGIEKNIKICKTEEDFDNDKKVLI